MRHWGRGLTALIFALLAAAPASAEVGTENVVGTICGIIETSAHAQNVPVGFLTRLIWQESNFQTHAVSPAGAQGIAQFMPGTATARGLADPFDPEQAIPKSAALLAELKGQFGNWGLAAAAYNAGPSRVARFVKGDADLPGETQDYVSIVTGHAAQEWRGADAAKLTDDAVFPGASCSEIVAKFKVSQPTLFAHSSFYAPWGVQISGAFNKAAALRQYDRAKAQYVAILGDAQPMILAGRLRSRGFRTFYRVRAGAPTRAAAEALCGKLEKVGGACVVLRSS